MSTAASVVLAAFAFPASPVNVTALTEKGGVFSLRSGINGADWWVRRDNGENRIKRNGFGYCVPALSAGAATTPAGSTLLVRQFDDHDQAGDLDDEVLSTTTSFADHNGFDATANGSTWTWTLPADRKLRSFFCPFVARAAGGAGSWTVTATLSDASVPPRTLVMPDAGGGFASSQMPFSVRWRAARLGGTLTLALTRTSGGACFIPSMDPCWMPIPGPGPLAGLLPLIGR